MLELHAATDLARPWRETDSPNNPHTLLEPILAAIESGERTRDVRNAHVLLAEIACSKSERPLSALRGRSRWLRVSGESAPKQAVSGG
jgi:hypothetical protein